MLVYRDRALRDGGPRYPVSLVGAADLCRVEAASGAIVWVGDQLIVPNVPDAAWADLPGTIEGGSWQVANLGKIDLLPLRRADGPWWYHHVNDAAGRGWQVPAILGPDGHPAFPIPVRLIGFEEVAGEHVPQYARQAPPEHARLIEIARAARTEIEACKLDQVEIQPLMSWTTALLAAGQRIHPIALAALGLVDDRLVFRALMAAAGFPVPEND